MRKRDNLLFKPTMVNDLKEFILISRDNLEKLKQLMQDEFFKNPDALPENYLSDIRHLILDINGKIADLEAHIMDYENIIAAC